NINLVPTLCVGMHTDPDRVGKADFRMHSHEGPWERVRIEPGYLKLAGKLIGQSISQGDGLLLSKPVFNLAYQNTRP
ncbi:hypothetical protein, partial [Endozoicomonas sp.]|uniref:hypothetical protein n=1 Tax=Endozoicomonas sp. TaxID=1892382 RepID=UPI00383B64EA